MNRFHLPDALRDGLIAVMVAFRSLEPVEEGPMNDAERVVLISCGVVSMPKHDPSTTVYRPSAWRPPPAGWTLPAITMMVRMGQR